MHNMAGKKSNNKTVSISSVRCLVTVLPVPGYAGSVWWHGGSGSGHAESECGLTQRSAMVL